MDLITADILDFVIFSLPSIGISPKNAISAGPYLTGLYFNVYGDGEKACVCVCVCVRTCVSVKGVYTLRAWSIVKNEGIIDFLREYLSCHRRSVFTLGSDATKNFTHTQTNTHSLINTGSFIFPNSINKQNRYHCL